MKIIVGLGNPGAKYAGTRHNLGFEVADGVAAKCRARAAGKAHKALVGFCRVAGEDALVAKPQTYMNLCGESVAAILKAEKAGPSDLIVIHDDLDLPLGRIRIRKSGGEGGHNGVRSVIDALGTGSFVRVKLGIGRPPEGTDPAEYVLSPFGEDELDAAADAVGRAVEAVFAIIAEGPDRAMNRYNKGLEPTV